MAIYNYIALNTKDGKNVSGAMEIHDEATLETKLTEMGFALQKAVKQKEKKKGPSKISRRDMIDFYNLMIYQVNAGLSIVESLTTAAGESKNHKLKQALSTVERKVKSGMMFFEALDGHPAAFPPNVVNMVRAGEMSCKLPETFKDLREYEEWQEKMQADIRQATIYPIIILVIMGAFILLLFTLVIPKFVILLETLKLELPLVTKIVFQSSDFAKATWWIWVMGFFLTKYGTRFARKRYEWFALQYDRLMLMLPAFGKLNIMIAMSRLTHNLSSLVGAGLTVLDALHHCRELVGNKVVEVALRKVKADVTAGVDFSEALAKHKVFPEMVIKMVALGEGTGFLEDALENASEFYSQAIPRQTKKIFSLLEPVLMLFIIGLIGTVALSIFMPIMEMMTGAKG
ncbi:MAG: type II secretory pathway component PulF [Verrucomicrobiales bacterium]|jgi:type II secretory pathway component PulF